MRCCTVLYYTILYCTVLYCTLLYCTVLYCTVLYCTALYYTALHTALLDGCFTPHLTALHHSIPRIGIARFSEAEREQILIYTSVLTTVTEAYDSFTTAGEDQGGRGAEGQGRL